MVDENKNTLSKANELYKLREYQEAHDIYENEFSKNSDKFTKWDKIFYAWSIYHLHVKNYTDEYELIESTKKIIKLTRQSDLNKSPTCAYTLSVFKVLEYLYKNGDYEYLLDWLDKIDPNLLDSKQSEFNGRLYPSRKEKYFNYASKTFFECGDYENCILISDKALRSLSSFTNGSDVWYNWRIAKSLKELGKPEKALPFLNEVGKVKRDWFVQKEIAETYYYLNDVDNALKYIPNAVLTDDPSKYKVNLYYLIYRMLKDSDPEIALMHAKLFLALKLDTSTSIPMEIKELQIDENELDADSLEKEIKEYWTGYKFKDQILLHGTITNILKNGKSGFIESSEGKSFYFNTFEFKDEIYLLEVGRNVSFYTQKGFDKSKNRESLNAVNIHVE